MKCAICNHEMSYYFTKDFDNSSDFDKMFGLGEVTYLKCMNCGFVLSKTHAEMSEKKWEELNFNFHTYFENPDNKKTANQPPYLEQATLIKILQKHQIISEKCLDWGGGYGTLSKILSKYFDISIAVYEKFIIDIDKESEIKYIKSENILNSKFETVINSAVFEHVRNRSHLDEIISCITDDGCLILHTVICENIPQDPTWFYFLPVHCAFHTNNSMSYLMEQWSFTSSIYCPVAKSWILLRKNFSKLEEKIERINNEFQCNYLFLKNGFLDYWK